MKSKLSNSMNNIGNFTATKTAKFIATFLLAAMVVPIALPIPVEAYNFSHPIAIDDGFRLTEQPSLAASLMNLAGGLAGFISSEIEENEKGENPAVSKSVLLGRVKLIDTQIGSEETLNAGQSMFLSALPRDEKGNIVQGLAVDWQSSDESVVAVVRGQAIALNGGEAVLTASIGKIKQESIIHIIPDKTKSSVNRVSSALILPGSKIVKPVPTTPTPPPKVMPGTAVSSSGNLPEPDVTPTPDPQPSPTPSRLWRSTFSNENNLGAPNGQTEILRSNGRTRERLGASNFSFGVPITSLAGRGINASVGMTYNSRLWNKSSDTVNGTTVNSYTYNIDSNWLSPGFNLSYGYLDSAYGYYSVVSPSGTRHLLFPRPNTQSTTSTLYESADGDFVRMWVSNIQVLNNSMALVVGYPDGTKVVYDGPNASSRRYATEVIDRNGNKISISYLNGEHQGRIANIRDTLNRYIVFNYDSNAVVSEKKLVSITAPGIGIQPDRQVARFYYKTIPFTPYSKFDGSVGIYGTGTTNPTTLSVLEYVYMPDTNRGYHYEYSNVFGMIYKITEFAGMLGSTTNPNVTGTITNEGNWVNYTQYNYPVNGNDIPTGVLTDVPKYSQRKDDWVGRTNAAAPITFYSINENSETKERTVTETLPDGTINESVSNFKPSNEVNGVFTDYWDDGLIKRSAIRPSAGAAPVSQQIFTWIEGAEINGRKNPRLQKTEAINDAGQSRATSFEYDGYNNQTVVREHDFAASGQLGTELKRTETSYAGDWANAGLLRLPIEIKTIVNNTVVSKTQIEYDHFPGDNPYNPQSITHRDDVEQFRWEYNPFVDHSVQVCNSSGTNCVWVLIYYPQSILKGNVTKVTSFSDVSTDTTASISTTKYDMTGNAVEAGVSCCRRKIWEYVKANEYAYPVSETKGDAGQETTSAIYDRNTGLITSAKDENNQTTTVTYDAATLRQTRIDKPNGAWTSSEVNITTYPFYAKQTSSLDANRSVSSWSFADGRGQTFRTRSQTLGGYLSSDTEFDILGRGTKSYSPYTTAGLNDARPANIKFSEVTQRDGLGRVTHTKLTDDTIVTASYNGTMATATDQAGKSRRQIADALGRTIRVDEPDVNGNLGTIAAPTQPTSYEYDGNDNLAKVTQTDGTTTQERLFKYDALSRLTHERQVEAIATLNNDGVKVATGGQWTGVYKYDTQSLLSEGTDARGVKTSFVYDGLNRVSTVTYSGETGFTTPNVTYTYDEAHANYFNKGRLTKVQTAAITAQDTPETKQIYDYDNVGQVVNHTQTIGNQSYNFMYGYNLAGQLTSEKYPSGKVFNYTVDDYGRLATVADQSRTYLNSVSFNDKGLLSSMNFGNGTSQSFNYNDRFQMTSQQLTKGSEVLQKYDYGYGQIDASGNLDLTKNNGQLGKIDSYIATNKQFTQKFSYDSIGRLSESKEYRGDNNSLTYKQKFDFDRFGNLYRKAANNGTSGQANPLAFTPIEDTDISKATNRFTSGTNYDDSGAVVSDNKFRSMNFAYDANGRMVKATKANTPDAFSVYDAGGMRVAERVNDVWRFSVYDIGGKVVAEYGGLTPSDEGGVKYLLTDWQGSTRAILSNSGYVQARMDYQVFGEEINSGVGLRTTAQGFGVNQDLKDRYALTRNDEATGLNHTPWRKQEQRAGRWTSPDPYKGSMNLGNPQSFNRYSYVGGNPIGFIDPSGLLRIQQCTRYWFDFGDGEIYHTSWSCHTIYDDSAESSGGEGGFGDGLKDLKGLIDAAQKVIDSASDACKKLLGKDASSTFMDVAKNIKFGKEASFRDSYVSARTNDDNSIDLNPGSQVFGAGLLNEEGGNVKFAKTANKKIHDQIAKASSPFEYAVAIIIHEFLHAIGKFPPDGGSASIKLTDKVLKACFSQNK